MKRSTGSVLTQKKLDATINHIAKMGHEQPSWLPVDERIGAFIEMVSRSQAASLMVKVGEHIYLVRAIRGLPYPTVAKKKPRK